MGELKAVSLFIDELKAWILFTDEVKAGSRFIDELMAGNLAIDELKDLGVDDLLLLVGTMHFPLKSFRDELH